MYARHLSKSLCSRLVEMTGFEPARGTDKGQDRVLPTIPLLSSGYKRASLLGPLCLFRCIRKLTTSTCAAPGFYAPGSVYTSARTIRQHPHKAMSTAKVNEMQCAA